MSAWQGPGHEHWEDATGAYVLGALGTDEAAGFETHLAACPACRAEVEELRPAVEALPASVVPLDPPRALGDRLLSEVRQEAELFAAAGPQADRPPRRRLAPRRAWREHWLPAVAAAGALAAGLIVGLVLGSGAHTRTVALADAPRVAGAEVRLVLRDGQATLTAEHLRPPPGNRVYQVWLKSRGGAVRPTPALFVPRADGSAIVALPPEAAHSREVMVSAEPRGGSPAPTTAPVLMAML